MTKYDFNSLDLEVVKDLVKKSSNYADVLRGLNFKIHSSIRKRLQDYLKENNIDTSHFTMKQTPFEGGTFNIDLFKDYLKSHKKLDLRIIKEKLIKYGIKEKRCEKCKRTEWEGNDIPLHLHHINFNHYDNSLENLQLLCANCHDQIHHILYSEKNGITRNYDILINDKTTEEVFNKNNNDGRPRCKICNKIITKGATYCDSCKKRLISENGAPEREILIKSFQESGSFVELAKRFNTTEQIVKRWLRARKLPDHKKELVKYIKEGRTDEIIHSSGKTVSKNQEEIAFYIKLGYDRGEISNKLKCNEATVKRVADKFGLRVRSKLEVIVERYDLNLNFCEFYYSYNDAARYVIDNNLESRPLDIRMISSFIRDASSKQKIYANYIWKNKILPDINSIKYNKDLDDNPS